MLSRVATKILLADCYVFCAPTLPFLLMALRNVNEKPQSVTGFFVCVFIIYFTNYFSDFGL